MKTLNILLVEDSPLDAELIEAYLVDGGLEFSLLCVETREDFVVALETHCYDIILADYILPCFNGIAALEIARATCPGVPFIFVSATLGEEVAIETLKSGATDYVLKRRLMRLVPSIERALREVQGRLDRSFAQTQRQESEARFRIMADTAPVMIWMSDTDQLGDYFNKVWLEFTGRTLAQEMGTGWMESLHPDDLPECINIYQKAFESRSEYRMECRLRRSDGEYRWVLGTGVPRYRPDALLQVTSVLASILAIENWQNKNALPLCRANKPRGCKQKKQPHCCNRQMLELLTFSKALPTLLSLSIQSGTSPMSTTKLLSF